MPDIFQGFVKFAREYPSLFLLLVSTILTAYFLEPSFSSILIHIVNLFLLLFTRFEARKAANYVISSVCILVWTGLSAVMIHPDNKIHGMVLIINFVVLLFMTGMARKDADLVAMFKTIKPDQDHNS